MYDAVAMQPIAQGILFAGTTTPPIPTFFGRGVSAVTRFAPTGAGIPAGSIEYILTLDAGLPGNAGEVAPGTVPIATSAGPPVVFTPTAEQAVAVRCQFTIRGSASNTLALNGTNLGPPAVSYLSSTTNPPASPVVPTTDGGDNLVILVFQSNGAVSAVGTAIDPNGANANGVEIVIWKVASASTAVGGG